MSQKKSKQRVPKKTYPATSERVQVAYANVANGVHDYHPSSLVLGFIAGLSSFALGAYNPVLAQDNPFQPQDLKQEGQESGRGLLLRDHQSDFRQAQELSNRSMGRQPRQDVDLTYRFVAQLTGSQDLLDGSRKRLDIPSGDLQSALLTLSEQAGLQLLYPSILIADFQTQGVQGTYSPDEALKELLNGTGLDYRFSDASTATLQAAATQDMGNAQHSGQSIQEDDAVIQADPIVVEEIIKRSKVFLPPVDGYKADQAIGSTRTALPIDETPTSIGVVTRDIIKDTFSRTQSDAFEHVSGISRNVGTRLGRSERFNIRGFSTDDRRGANGALRSNGLPVGTAFTPDPALIERYEIIKGPASIVGGAANPGGVVNRITKTPQDENFLTSEFQAGSFDLYRGIVDANGVLPQYKNIRGRLIFAVEEGGHFVDDIDVRQYTVAPSLEVDLFGGAGTLLLTGHYQKFDGSNFRGVPLHADGDPPDISRTQNFGGGTDNGNKTEFEGQNYEAHYVHEFIDNLKLSLKGKYSESDLLDKNIYPLAYAYGVGITPLPANGTVYQQLGFETADWETYAGEMFLSKEFELLGRKHQVLLGVDHRDQELENVRTSTYQYPPDNIFNPANTFQVPSDEALDAISTVRERVRLKQTGVFGQVVARPFPRLTMVGAFRHDWLDESLRNRITNTTSKGDDSDFTGRVGASYELFSDIRVYAGYAQSFQSNATSAPTRDGSLLSPETGENYEIGAKLNLLDGRVRVTTALYRNYRQDVASTDAQGFGILIGEQRHQGLEFDIQGQPWPGLNMLGAFTFYDAEITETNILGRKGTSPTRLPRGYIGKVFGTYELQSGPLQGFGFGGGVYFQGPYEILNSNAVPPFTRTDAYQRVDAVVFYRPPRKAYDFTINVRNLLDKTYIESPGSESSGNGFGAPVSVFGTLRVTFSPDLDWSPPWVR